MRTRQRLFVFNLKSCFVLLTIAAIASAVTVYQFQRVNALQRLDVMGIDFRATPSRIERGAITTTRDRNEGVWFDLKPFSWRDAFRRFDGFSINTTGASTQRRDEITRLLEMFPEAAAISLTTDDPVADLKSFHRVLSRVRTLTLSCDSLPPEFVFPQQLEKLVLSCERIPDDVKFPKELTTLAVRCEVVSVASLESWASLQQLRSLDLRGNDITDEHLPVLLRIRSLENLVLDHTFVSNEGLASHELPRRLRHVSLKETRLTAPPPLAIHQ